jgi:hypothetical protein
MSRYKMGTLADDFCTISFHDFYPDFAYKNQILLWYYTRTVTPEACNPDFE